MSFISFPYLMIGAMSDVIKVGLCFVVVVVFKVLGENGSALPCVV